MTPRLKSLYDKEIVKNLMNKLNYKNKHQTPRLVKIVLNMGLGEDASDGKKIKTSLDDLSLITGQKAIKTKARKAISGFKIRAGMPLGAKVTLRNKMMYEFLDRLINIAIPRIRDFRGLSPNGFDGNGNYTLGIKEQIIFPEINYDKIDKVRGLDITICTSASTNEEAIELLKYFNMPFPAETKN